MPTPFDISQHIEFDNQGRAICPSCALSKDSRYRKKNLSLMENGAYKCFAGCTPKEIREAIGQPKPSIIPTAITRSNLPAAKITVTPQQVRQATDRLLAKANPCRQWLNDRGITDGMIQRYQLGLVRSQIGNQKLPAICIPLPANPDGTEFYLKKRVAPHLAVGEQPAGYSPWSQYRIPALTWFSYLPTEAQETWLCEGEWDAIVLGWAVRHADLPIAVACFTCGCGTVPPDDQLQLLPGHVVIFYDRNDTPTKNGDRPGEVGAKKIAKAIGDRARIALVPMPEDCDVKGWDVSNALQHGYSVEDFQAAAEQAEKLRTDRQPNPLRELLMTNDEMISSAPDYVNWLVEDLLPANEMILLAASPRAGKSLMAMLLAKCVASGEPFLDRPVTQGPVIYVACEDAPVKLKQRELAQGWAEGLPVYWLRRFKLSQIDHLRELAEEIQPVLIVLDTLSRVRDDSITESSAEMSRTMEPLQELAEDLNCCIIPVHHTGKINMENANLVDVFDTIRGSSAIRATCRGTMVIAASENNYRLCVETGYAKDDLKVRLNSETLEWKLLGRWTAPDIADNHREAVSEFVCKVGQATFDEIHAYTQIPKWSLYKVLSRLSADGFLSKAKQGRQNVYSRLQVSCLQTLENVGTFQDLSNVQNPDPESNKGVIGQKDNFSFFPDNTQTRQTGTYDTLSGLPVGKNPETLSNIPTLPSNPDSVSVSDIGQTLENVGMSNIADKNCHSDCHNQSVDQIPETSTERQLGAADKVDSSLSRNVSTLDNVGQTRQNHAQPGDVVTINATATWFTKGSDRLPRGCRRRSQASAPSLSIANFPASVFEELIGDSELLEYSSDGERAKVRNLETGRISVFNSEAVIVLRPCDQARDRQPTQQGGQNHANG